MIYILLSDFIWMLYTECLALQWICVLLGTGTTTCVQDFQENTLKWERAWFYSLTQWKMPALARGWFHKDWRKPLIPCRAQTLDLASIHISTTAASLRAAGACVCPEKWKKNRVFIYLYQTKLHNMLSVSKRTEHKGFDTCHESYRNLLIWYAMYNLFEMVFVFRFSMQ